MENNQINNNIPSQEEIIQKMISDQNFRLELVTDSHYWFAHCYFAHYIIYPTAEFHKEMFGLTENENAGIVVAVAFRGSGKSTIFTMSYPIWAILGKQQKKFVIILSQTQRQARQHLVNLKQELERNKLLLQDLGPFEEETDEWGGYSLVIPKYNARITAASTEQSIRGLRHIQHRPDLIVADDIEDLQSVKTREGRNKTHNWLLGDVIPAGDPDTKIIVVGNLLHEDSVIMRLRLGIEIGEIAGTFKAYPLINGAGEILWPGKYPSPEAIVAEKRKIGNEFAWQREYLLNIVPDEEQAIHREWIQYYDEIPPPMEFESGYASHIEVRIGVDLAISKNDAADYTAMVLGVLYEVTDGYRIYILPKIINKHMNFPETVEMCKTLYESYSKKGGSYPQFVIEDVAYQKALPQQLESEGLHNVKTVRPGSQDKRSRLVMTANLIKTGKVLFPREGAEQLIQQIVHFGVEKHDDLADAFANLVLSAVHDPPRVPRIYFL